MLRSKSISAILLALSFLFNVAQAWPWSSIVIGYATVPEDVARRINEDNKPYLGDEISQRKLGDGFPLVNDPLAWQGNRGNWYCAVKAKKHALENVDKVWITRSLWDLPETDIVTYIRSLKPLWKARPEKALRFSWVDGKSAMRMLIPRAMVEGGDLGLHAECFNSGQDRMDYSSDYIKWDSWQITGYREARNPDPQGLPVWS
ncbi:hypothetical protein LZ554_006176 [Drepanopeziza brunnea f. sp. 'monogermtubi']|nr:hypothetical protein LZ554_006176 [Drepanopeziza brunnea f. sp. 'monogermtubi']